MDWLEFSVTADGEAAEAVAELFNRHGHGGAVVETSIDCFEYELPSAYPQAAVTVKTYLPMNEGAQQVRQRLEEGLWHLGRILPIPSPVIRELAEEDWANSWRKQYQPLRIGHKLAIVPAWQADDAMSDRVIIRLEPGMAFGTGLHPTTRLSLQALEQYLVPASTVMDVGTGSGVLAIAAAKLGARSVVALDADPVAVTVAQENVKSNGVAEQVTVQHGTLDGGSGGFSFGDLKAPVLANDSVYDLVVINILAPVIINMASALAASVAAGGRLIAAGLIDSQEAAVAQALVGQGLELFGRAQEKDWVALVAGRSVRVSAA